MNEATWLACEDPVRMLKFLRRKTSDRKLRLCACACCRHIAYLVIAEGKRAIEVAEDFADGRAGHDQLSAARLELEPYIKNGPEYVPWLATAESAYEAASEVAGAVSSCAAEAVEIAVEASGPESVSSFGTTDESRSKADSVCVEALRCIFGSPFRKVKFNKKWRTDTALALAGQMYESRDFATMPILADALQDAGCDNADILDHCRDRGAHVLGCWVIDLVLGKG
jgi:hypothetical protein